MMMARLVLIWVHLHTETPNKFGGFQIQVSWYQFGYKCCEGDFETTHIIEKNPEATNWHTGFVFLMCLLHEIGYSNILAQFPNENKVYFTSHVLMKQRQRSKLLFK